MYIEGVLTSKSRNIALSMNCALECKKNNLFTLSCNLTREIVQMRLSISSVTLQRYSIYIVQFIKPSKIIIALGLMEEQRFTCINH